VFRIPKPGPLLFFFFFLFCAEKKKKKKNRIANGLSVWPTSRMHPAPTLGPLQYDSTHPASTAKSATSFWRAIPPPGPNARISSTAGPRRLPSIFVRLSRLFYTGLFFRAPTAVPSSRRRTGFAHRRFRSVPDEYPTRPAIKKTVADEQQQNGREETIPLKQIWNKFEIEF